MRIFCKRAMRRILIFLLLLVTPVAAVGIRTAETMPPAGFYLKEETPAAERIREHLENNGFISVEDPEILLQQVRQGELDCGVVFPEDFSEKIAQGELKESLKFYASPSSFSPDLYKSHVAAIVFREHVPYICATAFEDTRVTQERVLAEYEGMYAWGHLFSFDVVATGDAPMKQGNRNMAIGATAILLLAALLALAAETADRAVNQLLPRLGLRKCVTRVLLPEMVINLLFAMVFAGGGLALAGLPELWLPEAIYCVAIWGCGLTLYSVLWSAKRMYVLLPMLVIAAVALCPIYTDLSILLPWLENIRMVLPAYWLWCIPGNLGLWIAISLALFAGGILMTALRCRWIYKYK